MIFTISMIFLLVGLTNKQFNEWTDPSVGGFILVGLIGSVLFIFAERRAKEMAALNLWRQRADLMQQLVQVRVTRANYVGL